MRKILKNSLFVIAAIIAILGLAACANDVKATAIELDKTELIMVVNETAQLRVTVDEKATDKSVEWVSSDETKVEVDESGFVTAKAEGKATITVSAKDGSGIKAMCKVYIAKEGEVACIKVKDGQNPLVVKGNAIVNLQDYIVLLPETATNKAFTAEIVNNPPADVATLKDLTLITGVTDGKVNLKIKSQNGKVQANITVKVELQANDYPENYYESVTHVGTLEKKYANYGSYEVKEITKKNVTGKEEITAYKIWYPADLEAGTDKYPAVVCLNGSNCTYADCEPIYRHLASWGFIVIGNNQTQAISGVSGLESVEILKELNTDAASPLYNKVNLEKIGIQGGSQGGSGAIHAATSNSASNIFASLLTLSAAASGKLGDAWIYDLSNLEIPCFMLSGTGFWDSGIVTSLDDLKNNFDACKGETYIARRDGYDHESIPMAADSYVVAWFLYTLKGDPEAKSVFRGETPELFNNTNWVDAQAKYD